MTAAGTLLATDALGSGDPLVYELDERIEDGPDGPGVLVSHGISPFLVDFSAVASFGLNAIVAPDASLVDRLLSGKASLARQRRAGFCATILLSLTRGSKAFSAVVV